MGIAKCCYAVLLLAGIEAMSGAAWAASSAIYTATSGNLSAKVDFELNTATGRLSVLLTDTSLTAATVPADVLTGIFFNATSKLTPISASLNGSDVIEGPLDNPGDGWGYQSRVDAHGKNSAISATGAVDGLGHSDFSAAENTLDGIGYGLVGAAGISANAKSGLTQHGPLIENSVLFILQAAVGFNLSQLGNSVIFQYGSSLDEAHGTSALPIVTGSATPVGAVPVPAAIWLVGSALAGVFGVVRRMQEIG